MIREFGPGRDRTSSLRDHDGWAAHAAFMDGLADEGFIVLGGPLGEEQRVLLIVRAADEHEVERRFAEDPWAEHMLLIGSLEPFTILLGGLEPGGC